MADTPRAGSESPRRIAADVVWRVLSAGGFIAAELDQELSRIGLDARDAALATELAYGTVRHRRALERRLLEHAPRGLPDPRVRAHLLVAAHQILLLDRVPAFAAVDEAVSNVERVSDKRVAGFANAVLRRLSQGPKLESSVALRESVPAWLLEELVASVGEQRALELLGAGEADLRPVSSARFVGTAPFPAWAGDGSPGRVVPRLLRFRRAGDLRRFPEWKLGHFVVQEEGSALCALALGARPGEKVLDACAGRGQKATLIAECIAPGGELWVSDLRERKLSQLVLEFERLALPAPRVRAVDWMKPPEDLPKDFDRVLVDAPCSGSGTLRHRPEIGERLKPEDVARLAAQALCVLLAAAAHAKPGGCVLFSVCSVLRRECEDVVAGAVAHGLEPLPLDAEVLQGAFPERPTSLRLLPSVHETDGFFLAAFQRR